MDAAFREYLEAMERRIVERVSERLGGRIDSLEGRIDAQTQTLRAEMVGMEQRLQGRIDAQTHALLAEMAGMEQRLIESIQHRREDIDAAFKDIGALKGTVRDHEKRIKALEAQAGR